MDWGEESLSPNERVFGWNSFAVLAMTSGVPENPVNAIAGSARATCQLRYVVGTEVDAILPALRNHLDTNGFQDIEIYGDDKVRFAATRQDAENIWVKKSHFVSGKRCGLLSASFAQSCRFTAQ